MINTPLQIGKTNRVNLLTDTAVFLTIKDYGLQDGLKYYPTVRIMYALSATFF